MTTSRKYLDNKPQININIQALEDILRREIPAMRKLPAGKLAKGAIGALYSKVIEYAVFGMRSTSLTNSTGYRFVINAPKRTAFILETEDALEKQNLQDHLLSLAEKVDQLRTLYTDAYTPLKGQDAKDAQKMTDQKTLMLEIVESIVIYLSVIHQTIKLVSPYPTRSK